MTIDDIDMGFDEVLLEGEVYELVVGYEKDSFVATKVLYLGKPDDSPFLKNFPHFFVGRQQIKCFGNETISVYRVKNYMVPETRKGRKVIFPIPSQEGKLFLSDICSPLNDYMNKLGEKTKREILLKKLKEAEL